MLNMVSCGPLMSCSVLSLINCIANIALCAGVPVVNTHVIPLTPCRLADPPHRILKWDGPSVDDRSKWATAFDGLKTLSEPDVYHVVRFLPPLHGSLLANTFQRWGDWKALRIAIEKATEIPIQGFLLG
jgi:hypothetical protein